MYRILLLIGLLLSSLAFSSQTICPEDQCIAIVNAGNSGSRLYIYQYELTNNNTPTNIKRVFSKTIEPGLASINLNQKSVSQYLAQLFSDVPEVNVPVYFYATSGMRMLSFARQQTYYEHVTKWFSTKEHWQLMTARTLKNKEEALFGWLAVNYELGALTSPNASLVSTIDTGSGSLQVAIPLQNVQSISSENYLHIHVYDRDVSLFVHGFLGLGQDEIRNQFFDHQACFSKHYPLPNGLFGTGDFKTCEKNMIPMINALHFVNELIQPVIEQNPNETWYIIGGISTMLQQRPFVFDNYELTSEELEQKADQQVCQQDWAILNTIYASNKYLYTNCLNASYFHALVVQGFGMSQTQPIHFISNKTSTNDWTLGALLFQISTLKEF